MTERKQVPEHARRMIARRIVELLDERDIRGKKQLTQARLGQRLGVSQEAARRAREPDGVTPAIVNGMARAFGYNVLGNERIETVRTNDDGSKTTTRVSYPILRFEEAQDADATSTGAAERTVGSVSESLRTGQPFAFPLEMEQDIDPDELTRQEATIELLVRRGVRLRDAVRAINAARIFKHDEPIEPEQWADLAHSLVLANEKGKMVGVAPAAKHDPDNPERRGVPSSIPPGQQKAFRAKATQLVKGSVEPLGKRKRTGE